MSDERATGSLSRSALIRTGATGLLAVSGFGLLADEEALAATTAPTPSDLSLLALSLRAERLLVDYLGRAIATKKLPTAAVSAFAAARTAALGNYQNNVKFLTTGGVALPTAPKAFRYGANVFTSAHLIWCEAVAIESAIVQTYRGIFTSLSPPIRACAEARVLTLAVFLGYAVGGMGGTPTTLKSMTAAEGDAFLKTYGA